MTGATVFIVDDDASVRRAAQRVLNAAGLPTAAFECAQRYLDEFDREAPGCVLLDLAMPGLSGLKLQKALADRGGAPPIIFLSGHADVATSVEAMKAGAVEFLTKPVDADALVRAVRSAIETDRVRREDWAVRRQIDARLSTLTPRESQVLRGVIAGKLNKQIAGDLGAAEKTIKTHRGRMMEKMGVRSVAELVHAAARVGIC